jgi:protein gp37
MGDGSGIEWTDATWNPVTGCVKVSQGCKNCYAKREWPRLAGNSRSIYAGRKFEDVRCHPERLKQPLLWARPRRIFVNSMSDLFQESVPYEFIDQVFGVMSICGQHSFQVLTKRPERALEYLSTNPGHRDSAWKTIGVSHLLEHGAATEDGVVEVHARKLVPGYPPRNVWLGVSVEDQETADARIPLLIQLPSRVRFLSVEPLLGPIDLAGAGWAHPRWHETAIERVQWMIVGGESGGSARPMASEWVRTLRDQAAEVGIPFFFKQWGEWAPPGQVPESDRMLVMRTQQVDVQNGTLEHQFKFGKRRTGRLLDGRTHDAMPPTL